MRLRRRELLLALALGDRALAHHVGVLRLRELHLSLVFFGFLFGFFVDFQRFFVLFVYGIAWRAQRNSTARCTAHAAHPNNN